LHRHFFWHGRHRQLHGYRRIARPLRELCILPVHHFSQPVVQRFRAQNRPSRRVSAGAARLGSLWPDRVVACRSATVGSRPHDGRRQDRSGWNSLPGRSRWCPRRGSGFRQEPWGFRRWTSGVVGRTRVVPPEEGCLAMPERRARGRVRRTWASEVAGTLLLAAVYVVAARAAFALGFVHTSIAPVWLPRGSARAAVLLFGGRWSGCSSAPSCSTPPRRCRSG